MSNYRLGCNQEYRVMDSLRKEDYLAVRSAGSHGIIDLVGIPLEKCSTFECTQADRFRTRLIQVKCVTQKHAAFKKEIAELKQLSVNRVLFKVELWIWWARRKDRPKYGWEKVEC